MKKRLFGFGIILTGALLLLSCKNDDTDYQLETPHAEQTSSVSDSEQIASSKPVSELTSPAVSTEPEIPATTAGQTVSSLVNTEPPASTEHTAEASTSGTTPPPETEQTTTEETPPAEEVPNYRTDFSDMVAKTEFPEYSTATRSVMCNVDYYYDGKNFSYCMVPCVDRFEDGEWKRLNYVPPEFYDEAAWPCTVDGMPTGPDNFKVGINKDFLIEDFTEGEYRIVVLLSTAYGYTEIYAPFTVKDREGVWRPTYDADFSNITAKTEYPEYKILELPYGWANVVCDITNNNVGKAFRSWTGYFVERLEDGEWKRLDCYIEETHHETAWAHNYTEGNDTEPNHGTITFRANYLEGDIIAGEYRLVILVGDYKNPTKIYAYFRLVE